ncbi:MAG: hypothetical protein COV33_00670 [Candidatus Zambryskibacteria bacterium CG10_big_fil_rev_8_21_14_0_10_34_34]|uniref:Uncharacterized protein n=1 Tax=Candidatus Zambryskibacteria bacterium CG10_big_fil_rev_8_21_14_0_10_34_34 TaxID=1975114 RepID=A0A2H0R174_9BACT|nr:MAG: hypothetical protein COV33_00670 [Candidatus Zambryskibacteria bacterium CG10_big_fil_rev_8_21_14_0_10_34_34]
MEFISSNKKFIKITFALIAFSFLWFGTFGLMYHMSEMKQDTQMSGCLFDQTEVCGMSISEHISSWKSAFTTLPQNISLLSLLVLALLSILIVAFWRDSLFEFYDHIASRLKLYIKQHPQTNFFNFLREAFSQGILNPKIYGSIL